MQPMALDFDLGDVAAPTAAPEIDFDLGEGTPSAYDITAARGYRERKAAREEQVRRMRATVATKPVDTLEAAGLRTPTPGSEVTSSPAVQRNWMPPGGGLLASPNQDLDLALRVAKDPDYAAIVESLSGKTPRRSVTAGGYPGLREGFTREDILADISDFEREQQQKEQMDLLTQVAIPKYGTFAAQLKVETDRSPVLDTTDKRFAAANSALTAVGLPNGSIPLVADMLDRLGMDTKALRDSAKTQGFLPRATEATASVIGQTAVGVGRVLQPVIPDSTGYSQALNTLAARSAEVGEQANVNPTALSITTAIAQQAPLLMVTRGAASRFLTEAAQAQQAVRAAIAVGDVAKAQAAAANVERLMKLANLAGATTSSAYSGLQIAGETESQIEAMGDPNAYPASLAAGVTGGLLERLSPASMLGVPRSGNAKLDAILHRGRGTGGRLETGIQVGAHEALTELLQNEAAAEAARTFGAGRTADVLHQQSPEEAGLGGTVGFVFGAALPGRAKVPQAPKPVSPAAVPQNAPPAPVNLASAAAMVAAPPVPTVQPPAPPLLMPPAVTKGKAKKAPAPAPAGPVQLPPPVPVPQAPLAVDFDLEGNLQAPAVTPPSTQPQAAPVQKPPKGQVQLPQAPLTEAEQKAAEAAKALQPPAPPQVPILPPPPTGKGRVKAAPKPAPAAPVELPPAPTPPIQAEFSETGELLAPKVETPAPPQPAAKTKLPPKLVPASQTTTPVGVTRAPQPIQAPTQVPAVEGQPAQARPEAEVQAGGEVRRGEGQEVAVGQPEPPLSTAEAIELSTAAKPGVNPANPQPDDPKLRSQIFRYAVRDTTPEFLNAPRYNKKGRRPFTKNEQDRAQRLSKIVRQFGKPPQLPTVFRVENGKIVDMPAPHPFITFRDILNRVPPETHQRWTEERMRMTAAGQSLAGFTTRKMAELGWTPAHNELGQIGEKIDKATVPMPSGETENQWPVPTMNDQTLADLEALAPKVASKARKPSVQAPPPQPATIPQVPALERPPETGDQKSRAEAKAPGESPEVGTTVPEQQTIEGLFPPPKPETRAMQLAPTPLGDTDVRALKEANPAALSEADRHVLDLAKQAGVNLKLVDAPADFYGAHTTEDGKHTIYISANAEPGHVARVLGHELTHAGLVELPMVERAAVFNQIRRAIGPKVFDEIMRDIKSRYDTRGWTIDDFMHEVSARYGEQIYDPAGDLFGRLYVHKPGIITRVLRKITDFIDKLGLRGEDRRIQAIIRGLHARAVEVMREQAVTAVAGPPVGETLDKTRFMAQPSGPLPPKVQDLHDLSTTRERVSWLGKLSGRSKLGSTVSRQWYQMANNPKTVARDNPVSRPVFNALRYRHAALEALPRRLSQMARSVFTDHETTDYATASALLHKYDQLGQDIPANVLAAESQGVQDIVNQFRQVVDESVKMKAVAWRNKLNVQNLSPDPLDQAPYQAEITQYDQDVQAADAALVQAKRVHAHSQSQMSAAALATAQQQVAQLDARKADMNRMRTFVHIQDVMASTLRSGYVPHYWSGSYKTVSVLDPATDEIVERVSSDSASQHEAQVKAMQAKYPGFVVLEHAVKSDTWFPPGGSTARSGSTRSKLKALFDSDPNIVVDLFGAGANGQQAAAAFLAGHQGHARGNTAGYETDLKHILARHILSTSHFVADAHFDAVVQPIMAQWEGQNSPQFQLEKARYNTELAFVEALRKAGIITGTQAQTQTEAIKQRFKVTQEQHSGRPQLHAWWKDHIDHVRNGPQGAQFLNTAVARLKQFASTVFMGGNVTTAVANLFQPLQVGLPLASGLGGMRGGAEILKAQTHVAQFIKGVFTHHGLTGKQAIDLVYDYADSVQATNPGLAAALRESADNATVFEVAANQDFQEALRRPEEGALAQITSKTEGAQDALWHFFRESETANRLMTFVAGYKIATGADAGFWRRAKAQGYGGSQDPAAFAAWFTDEVNFIMGEVDNAPYNKGLVKLLTSLKSYPTHVWQLSKRMEHAAKELGGTDKIKMRAAMYSMFGANMLMAGALNGLPLTAVGTALVNLAMKMAADDEEGVKPDVQTSLYRWLGADSVTANLLVRGALPAAGVPVGSFPQRLSFFGGLVPSDTSFSVISAPISAALKVSDAIKGTAGALRTDTGPLRPDDMLYAGLQAAGAFSALSPAADIYEAAVREKGFHTKSGKPLVTSKDLTETDYLMMAFGLRPEAFVRASTENRVVAKIEAENKAITQHFITRFTDAITEFKKTGDDSKLKEAQAALVQYETEHQHDKEKLVVPRALVQGIRNMIYQQKLGGLHPKFIEKMSRPAVQQYEGQSRSK